MAHDKCTCRADPSPLQLPLRSAQAPEVVARVGECFSALLLGREPRSVGHETYRLHGAIGEGSARFYHPLDGAQIRVLSLDKVVGQRLAILRARGSRKETGLQSICGARTR